MTFEEMTRKVAGQTNLTKGQSGDAMRAFVATMRDGLNTEGRVAIPGFGVLVRVDRAARKGRNPQTGAPIVIPAKRTVRFKATAALEVGLGQPEGGDVINAADDEADEAEEMATDSAEAECAAEAENEPGEPPVSGPVAVVAEPRNPKKRKNGKKRRR